MFSTIVDTFEFMKREVVKTQDGSTTIYIPEMDENYHSTHGAINEAMHVFIDYGLHLFSDREEVKIFELGLGTGLNALLTFIHAKSAVAYTGIEAFPVSLEMAKEMNYVEEAGKEYSAVFDQMHAAPWEEVVALSDRFDLMKVQSKIQEFDMPKDHFDLIYFDAFGPRAQSEMWELPVLEKMYKGLKNEGVLVTYCAKGQFKRDLKSLGFEIEELPGPPGKREMTRATKKENE